MTKIENRVFAPGIRRAGITLLAVMLATAAGSRRSSWNAAVAAQAPPAGPSIQLNPVLPPTVTFGDKTPVAIENAFDIFSWNSFIALIWPPARNGQGDPKKKPGQSGDNTTVWETWIGLDNIFLDGGKTPSWDAPPVIPQACQVNRRKGERVLVMVGKTPNLLTAAEQPFKTGPLIDLRARFRKFLNRAP